MGVKTWLAKHPRLLHTTWGLRMTAIQGPWQPLLLAYCRRYARNPRIAAGLQSLLPELEPAAVAAELDQNGFAGSFRLPEAQIDQISEYIERSPQQRYDDPHLHCDAVHEVACDPNVLDVVRRYFRAEPILFRSAIWRSNSVKNPDAVGDFHLFRFHFDVADVKSVVLFVYLTDVDEDSGPHMVIPRTHRPKPLGDTMRIYLEDRIAQDHYADRIKTVTGARGTAFFEEQTTYHKQSVPRRYRIMMSITYTIWRIPGRHRLLPGRDRGRAL